MAPGPGARLDARHQGDRARPRARERAGLLLRPQSRRHRPPEGLRGPDLRPHRPQGRPHRHRDHQPAGRADVGVGRGAARGAPRGGARAGARRQGAGRRAHDRHARGRARLRAGARRAAGHRRRPHDVPLPHALGRQELRRPGDGAARGAHAARHGDGAVPPHRRDGRRRHAADRHHHRGGPARRRRLPAERREGALHVELRCARRARHARHRLPRHDLGDPRRARHAPRRALHLDGPPRARQRAPPVQGHGRALRRLRVRPRRAASSRWCPPRTT